MITMMLLEWVASSRTEWRSSTGAFSTLRGWHMYGHIYIYTIYIYTYIPFVFELHILCGSKPADLNAAASATGGLPSSRTAVGARSKAALICAAASAETPCRAFSRSGF